MVQIIISAIFSLLEKLSWKWWTGREVEQKQENRPLTNDEEIADIDKLP